MTKTQTGSSEGFCQRSPFFSDLHWWLGPWCPPEEVLGGALTQQILKFSLIAEVNFLILLTS